MGHRSYLLELCNRTEFRPKAFSDQVVRLGTASTTEVALCRRLWTEVGCGFWSEREDWTLEQ